MTALRFLAFCVTGSLLWAVLVPPSAAQTDNEEALTNFYIVTHVVSDASPFRYEYVLDVRSQDKNVLVREIRIAPPSSSCPSGVTVKAANRVLMKTTPKRVARLNLCSLEPASAESAISNAQFTSVVTEINDIASYSIVALCRTTEKVFNLPYPETVDFKKLKKINPQLTSLWEVAHKIQRRAFGKQFSFYDVSVSSDEAFQAAGAEIVPAIKSGIYARGFQNGSHLEILLSEYSGPVKEIDPWYVEFVGPEPPGLDRFQLPVYPPLARQTRIEGEVRLVAVIDPQTGLIKEVKVSSGHPLLTDAAVVAVKGWHFQTERASNNVREITLRFALRCASHSTTSGESSEPHFEPHTP